MTHYRLFAFIRNLMTRAGRHFTSLIWLCMLGSSTVAFAAPSNKAHVEIKPAVIYHNYCSVCHGDKGDGRSRAQGSLNPPPVDFTTPLASRLTRAGMIEAVTNGRPGTAMTPWKSQLNAKEIAAVVDYVRNTFMPAAITEDSSRGRTVYSKNCSVCHGEKGDGRSRAQGSLNPPPLNFTTPGLSATLTVQRMITSTTFGRAETAMMGFKNQLSKEDISAVVDYIREGFMGGASIDGISGIRNGRAQHEIPAAAAPANAASAKPAVAAVNKPVITNMSAAMPNGLKGDLVKGGAFYMSNCATCHGFTGDGRGPRAYFINPKPRDFLHPASRQALNRPILYEAIAEGRYGTEMPAWNKVLEPQEIANIAEFVFQRFIKTDPAVAGKAEKVPKK